MGKSPNLHPEMHRRHSMRLKAYDYNQAGDYFITICTHMKICLFGDIVNGEMHLNRFGEIVASTWNDLIDHIDGIELGPFVVMPNHVHGIIIIIDRAVPGVGLEPTPTFPNLSEIVRQFKTFTARRINTLRRTSGEAVWQRSYWDHIIRNDKSRRQIGQYIINNPAKWGGDRLFSKKW